MEENSLREMVDYGTIKLAKGGVDSPRLDAELILAWVIGRDRLFLYSNPAHRIDSRERKEYFALLDRRAEGMPVHYITGSREFMGLGFNVNPSVLIPRPDTETLVETALEWLKRHRPDGARALDMGTGSGAVAISLACYHKGLTLKAVDISPKALEVARVNALRHGVEGRVEFIRGDLFSPFAGSGIKFDLVVSNPPYISEEEMADLQREVLHEPSLALCGGTDGLCFYRKIAAGAPAFIKKGGLLAVEIAFNQAEAVQGILWQTGGYTKVRVVKDLAGNDRVVLGTASGISRRPVI